MAERLRDLAPELADALRTLVTADDIDAVVAATKRARALLAQIDGK